MGKGFKSRGGGMNPINFKVVGGTMAPANPKENWIWVNTDQKITSWIFCVEEPAEPVEGVVWFKTGASSATKFNALKKNAIQVYPFYCYQWSGSAWVKKTAQSYQGGAWVDWITYLYNTGNVCSEITGGWLHAYRDSDEASEEISEMQASAIYVYAHETSTDKVGAAGRVTANKIDLTNANTLRATGNCSAAKDNGSHLGIRVVSTCGWTESYSADVRTATTGDFDLSLDVSNLSGSYYVLVYAYSYSNSKVYGTFSQIWYE